MFEEDDRETGYAVFLAITLAIVVSLFVIAIGIGSVIGEAGRRPPSAAFQTPSVVRVIARVHFEPGKADAPEDSPMLLRPAIRAAKAAPNSRLVVSSYHDASGDAAANTELARRRALAVRDALMAAGISEKRIELARPGVTMGVADPQQALRVDITLR